MFRFQSILNILFCYLTVLVKFTYVGAHGTILLFLEKICTKFLKFLNISQSWHLLTIDDWREVQRVLGQGVIHKGDDDLPAALERNSFILLEKLMTQKNML